MGYDVSIWTAFLAGVISFLSPCVLPLVPPYLCYLTGETLDELTAEQNGAALSLGRVMPAAVAFVLGFATVFVGLGAAASVVGQLLHQYKSAFGIAAGIIIIVMGLHFLGLFRFNILNREVRYQHKTRPAGLLGAYAIGLAFAFGWTPCIGPVLGSILTLAGTEEDVTRGAFLLAVYSAGLGVPFLIAAYGINGFLGFMKGFRRHMGKVEKTMGAMLVITGVMFLTGTMQALSYWLIEAFPGLANLG